MFHQHHQLLPQLCRRAFRAIAAVATIASISSCRVDDAVAPAAQATLDSPPSAAVAAGTNLIGNPALEIAGVSGAPAQWSRSTWGWPSPSFSYPVTGRSGSAAAVSYRRNSSGGARWQHDAVAVSAGAEYRFTTWYKATTGTSVVFEYSVSGSSARSYIWLANLPATGSVWTEFTATFVVPSGFNRASVLHLIRTTGSLTIDDVSLVATADPDPDPTPVPGPFTEGMVSLTFDDSWESQYVNALPVLENARLKGTFYLSTTMVQQSWFQFMSPSMVQDIASKGHEIASHTQTHPDLTTLSLSAATTELTDSRAYLQALTGQPVRSFAYPFGRTNAGITNLIPQLGYTSARGVGTAQQNTAQSDVNNLNADCLEPTATVAATRAKIDAARANRTWYILCIHEVKIGGNYPSMAPADFQSIVDYIVQTGVKVVTVSQGRALM